MMLPFDIERATAPRTVRGLAPLGLVVALAAASCSTPSPDASPKPLSPAPAIARLTASTGVVKVKLRGVIDWVPAAQNLGLGEGDLVRTDPRAVAEITFLGGLVLKVSPDSLLQIEPAPSLKSGRLAFSADSRRARKPAGLEMPAFTWEESGDRTQPPSGEVDLETSGGGRFDQHSGAGRVTTAAGDMVDLKSNERLRVDDRGRPGAKLPLPARPRLLAPAAQAVLSYVDPAQATTVLVWASVSGAASYHVMVDHGGWFTEPLLDRSDVTGTSLELRGLAPGKYYWRVRAVGVNRTQGGFSEFARFTVPGAVPGPPLVVESLEVRKNVVQISGRTEPGATVTVNDQRIDVREDGSFAEFVTLPRLGEQTIVVRAQGARGSVTTREQRVRATSF